ncbi:MAG: DUF1800 family protein [Pseudomonadales bacterium]
MSKLVVVGVLLACIAGCGGGGGGGNPAAPAPAPPAPPPPSGLFNVVSGAVWNETAVRQVLHTFAFGGHASDSQVAAWAAMHPLLATREILVLTPRHDLLSPPDPIDELADKDATLEEVAAYWASDDPTNLVDQQFRYLFDATQPNMFIAAELTWGAMTTKFGVNPIRQRIGLFETNYHMVVHQLIGNINDLQLMRYYDNIVNALASGADYEDVLTQAAVSSAIATQYGHRENVFFNGQFFGNEDFGREYHQLFFGILGENDPAYHEAVSIKNTAQALTGIRVPFVSTGFAPDALQDAALHNPNDLEILGQFISGSTALEKFQNLSDHAINHPESLANLPIIIISELADDNLTDSKKQNLRDAWASMPNKNLMQFLQDYAASPMFHSAERIKLLSSFERHFLVQNLMTLNNTEGYLNVYNFFRYNTQEGVAVFKPMENVFGGQRGRDAAASSLIFRSVYNRSTEEFASFVNPTFARADGSTVDKDWRQAIAANPATGAFEVQYVAEKLWQRFIADGLANFGTLERAEVYALLTSAQNFAFVATNGADPDRLYSAVQIESDVDLQNLLDTMANNPVALDDADVDTRRIANAVVGQAINFIVATPYALVLQGHN